MKGSLIVLFVGLYGIIVGFLLRTLPARGCATVENTVYGPSVQAEQAMIIWDARHQTEHFIRRASFESRAHDFGFLVPTPSRPQLAVADDGIFQTLSAIVRPKVKTVYEQQWVWRFGPWGGKWTLFIPIQNTFGAAENQLSDDGGVQVLETRKVGGYEATVLRASDAAELTRWLQRHGYTSRPSLKGWLQPYIQHGWILTAFKIAGSKSQQSENVQTGTIRMSFRTSQPFFPYSEPKDTHKNIGADGEDMGHSLNAYFVGEKRYAGNLKGQDAKHQITKPWNADVPYANNLSLAQRQSLITEAKISSADLPASAVLTYFDDWTKQRPATTDLFFASSSDQHHVIPPPHTHYQYVDRVIPFDWMAVGVLAVGGGLVVWKRKSAH